MNKLIKKTKFAVYYIDEEDSLLTQIWTNSKQKMNTEQYKIDMVNYLELTTKFKTKKALIDTRLFGYAIDPEVQLWVDKKIAIVTNKIVKKIAFIMSDDLFEQVSIKQTMDEKSGKEYEGTKFFNNEADAKIWLFAK